MNLLAELTANAYQIDRRALGKRVTFAVEGEEAEERRLEREAPAINPYGTRHMVNGIPKRELVMAALRDGRARFVGDITSVTDLAPDTVIRVLRQLRIEGAVEFNHVGTFRMWSRTRPADDPQSHGSPPHSVR